MLSLVSEAVVTLKSGTTKIRVRSVYEQFATSMVMVKQHVISVSYRCLKIRRKYMEQVSCSTQFRRFKCVIVVNGICRVQLPRLLRSSGSRTNEIFGVFARGSVISGMNRNMGHALGYFMDLHGCVLLFKVDWNWIRMETRLCLLRPGLSTVSLQEREPMCDNSDTRFSVYVFQIDQLITHSIATYRGSYILFNGHTALYNMYDMYFIIQITDSETCFTQHV